MNCICPSFTETAMVLPLLGHELTGEKNLEYRDLVSEQGLIRYSRTLVFICFALGQASDQNQVPIWLISPLL